MSVWRTTAALAFVLALFLYPALRPNVVPPATPSTASSSSAGGSWAVVGGQAFHAGKVHQGQKIQHSFEIKNVGPGDLILGRGESSCACTIGESAAERIPSGQVGTVAVTAETDLFLGEMSSVVRLSTTDSSRPEIRLEIFAEILPVFDISPKVVQLGTVLPGARRIAHVAILPLRADKLTSVRSTNEDLRVHLDPNGTDVWIDVRPEAKTGAIVGNVVVKTTSAYRPELRVFVEGAIAASPAHAEAPAFATQRRVR